MRSTFRCFTLLALCGAASAQNTLFAEDFAAGIPPGWTHLFLAVPMDPWTAGISPATNSPDVYHEWFCNHGGLNRKNVLLTPAIDLRGLTRVDFSCVQHQMFPLMRSLNRVEVSTDGGATFVVMHDETGTWSGPGTIQFALDAFAGLPDVRVAFHYEGAVANEWRIDDVLVTTPQPLLDVTGLTAGGIATIATSGGAAGALIVPALSLTGSGPLPSPFGTVWLSPPIVLLAPLVADGSGGASMTLPIPASAVGVPLDAQALEFAPNGAVQASRARHAVVQ